MFFLVLSGMSKYSAYSASGTSANELFKHLPKALQALLGVGGGVDLSTAIGFYSVLFLYIIVMASIHASLLGAEIISKEEQDKTAEFLFAKPVSRTQVITQKLLASVFNIVVLNLVALVSSIAIVAAFNKGASANTDIVLLMVGLLFVQLIFASIGMAAAAISKKPKRAAPIATGFLLVTFFLSVWLDIYSKLPGLKYLTPFQYFVARNIIRDTSLDPIYIALSVGIVAVMLLAVYLSYNRRDLST
jgi:ABC-2 type transport system permease protein